MSGTAGTLPRQSPVQHRPERWARLGTMPLVGLVLVVLLGTYANAADLTAREHRKIEYLIASVETLQAAQFIRNGKSYDARAAADHLRLKLRTAGSRVATADDFIRYCASVSSLSGMPYQIRFADGRIITSEAYLRQKLAELGPEGPDVEPGISEF